MSEKLEMLRRVRERILPKVPRELRPEVEIEVMRMENEVALKDDVVSCTSCPLAQGCTQKVPGAGLVPADIMFVGEA